MALHPGAQRLVAFLALHDRPVSRAHVAAALWLDASEGRCSANLRSALWRLRKVGVPLILSDRAGMRLASGVEVDTRAVRAGAQRLLETPTHDGLDAEVALLASELLPDWYDDWVVVERERFRQLALHALEALADRLTAAGRHGHAVQAALAAVQLEPLRESSRRALIRAHLSEGNVSEALREFRAYGALLHRELGVDPTPQFRALLASLRPGRRGQPARHGTVVPEPAGPSAPRGDAVNR